MANVQVHVDEYIDTDIDIEDYLDEVKTYKLEEELATRKDSRFYKLKVHTLDELHKIARAQLEKNRTTAREFLCNILGLTHAVSTDDILTEIKSRIV